MLQALFQAFSNLFKPVHTLKEEQKLPKDYRGLIEFNEEHCIFCDKCEKVCPPKSIVFYQHRDGSKEYQYNPWLCIYCGECVRACPKADEALWQSEKKQESAVAADDVNKQWFVWQEASKRSREEHAALKKRGA
ncbi:MAG: 4Fe-4S dicluster domain-containing protein [Campylobacterota bacterium]|nr:4Fe-4S dicluster domain-containing protein [Campylobacterota bacterium]